MNFLRAFGNQPRHIGRVLSNRNIKHLHKAWFHQRPVSVILYSPERLVLPVCQSLSPLDFEPIYDWLKHSKCFNLKKVIDSADERITPEKFETIVDIAFNTLFDPFRSQSDSDPETVLFYYTGHGLTVKEASVMREKSDCMASPDLNGVEITKEMLERATKYIKRERPLKGGEFCLHQFGFCDLAGLLEPWTTALTRSSTKKNKHLVVIADSCYSGMLVKDLQKLARASTPWNQNGCTVTVQSACSHDEPGKETSFSPCFAHFNKPENHKNLESLKEKWNELNEMEKDQYRQSALPSPQLATTIPQEMLNSDKDSLTMDFRQFPGQGFPLTLFCDAGFYKFCYLSRFDVF